MLTEGISFFEDERKIYHDKKFLIKGSVSLRPRLQQTCLLVTAYIFFYLCKQEKSLSNVVNPAQHCHVNGIKQCFHTFYKYSIPAGTNCCNLFYECKFNEFLQILHIHEPPPNTCRILYVVHCHLRSCYAVSGIRFCWDKVLESPAHKKDQRKFRLEM